MTRRSPWPVWLLALAILAIALAAARCWAPVIGPSVPATPSPTYAIVATVTVLPSSTAAPGTAPTVQPSPTVPTVTPAPESILLTPCPTPVPTRTPTVEPTATETPRPTRTVVIQQGKL